MMMIVITIIIFMYFMELFRRDIVIYCYSELKYVRLVLVIRHIVAE